VRGSAVLFIEVEMGGEGDAMRPQKPDRGGDRKIFLAHDQQFVEVCCFLEI